MKTEICLLGAILLAGCIMKETPEVPTFQNYVGQGCGWVCQREDALCTSECTQVVKSRCRSECNQKLKECYDYCLAEESEELP